MEESREVMYVVVCQLGIEKMQGRRELELLQAHTHTHTHTHTQNPNEEHTR